MIEYSLSVQEWLKLSPTTRAVITDLFSVPRSRGAQIETMGETSVVKSDGCTEEDLKQITIEKMQSFLNDSSSSDYVALFNAVVTKVETKVPEVTEPAIDPKTLLLEEWVAILNRIKGQSVEHQMERELELTLIRLFNIKTQINENAANAISANEARLSAKTKKAK